MAKNYYEILGVDKSSSAQEIKKAYRKLAHKYHPDKQGGDETKFKEVNEAYQVLSDPQKKSQYDQFGSTFDQAGGGAGGFSGQGFDFSDLFGQGGFNFSGGSAGGFEDVFSDIFGGGRSQGRTQRGRDIHLEVTLSLKEAHEGVRKTISVTKQAECDHCHGSGAEPGSGTKTCPTCDGQGTITRQVRTMLGTFAQRETCSTCHGKGTIPEKNCTVCGGDGVNQKNEDLEISIPAGMSTGQTLEIPGKGEAAPHGGRPGNVYVTVTVENSSQFERRGEDLYQTIDIPFSKLVLGGKVEVETIDSEVTLTVPKQTQSGEVFRLRGKGMHRLHGRGLGDMYVTLRAQTPTNLSRKQKNLIKELQKEGL